MQAHKPEFLNRREAGLRLAAALRHLSDTNPVVLALPRGGVPVAFEVAQAFDAELDLVMVRKIGAPGHEELGIGAVVDGAHPQIVLNEDLVREFALSPTYIQDAMRSQLAEIERRRQRYQTGTPPADIEGRTVILVDDGIATGATVRAALKGLRRSHPARLVLAVPVAPADTFAELEAECDEIICLTTPYPFHAVGLHYRDFDQTTDEEVIALLRRAQRYELPG
ncbi:phosphoribosyltransferase [Sphingomonas sp. LaA6.9]|uniref:phosphoribosyltransferase n=1 Tax=Sphingomonas sp. LaA6.9 TaxID=2919914 RepID=UPI001F4F6071|nr:phosphoribosyltransferase [Sphingomonas sp. LaA6.9]MCJ8156857.1 phosphoribosyltransferase [Sphingomonas sp. LaA6.9]